MNLRHVVCLAALAAAGCSRSNPQLDAKLAQQDAAIKKLEGQVAELERKAATAASDQRVSEVQRYSRQVGLGQKEVMRSLRQQQNQLDDLRVNVGKLAAAPVVADDETAPSADGTATASGAPQARKSNKEGFYAPVSVYTPSDPVVDDFIEPPTSARADRFPVGISNVRPLKVVTGTHTTTELVPMTNTVEDEFGIKVPQMAQRDVEREEYDFQVGFAARNLTRTPKTLTVTAGRDAASVTLQAGETLTNLTVAATYGASLSVRAGGEVRRFEVNYED